jgi:transcriptional regulator GlxA family with amidase domain
MVSICTGACVLAEAGVLDGRRATTHWAHTDRLARRFPKAKVDPSSRPRRGSHAWRNQAVGDPL